MRASLVDLIAALLGVVLAWRVMVEAIRRPYASPPAGSGIADVPGRGDEAASPGDGDPVA